MMSVCSYETENDFLLSCCKNYKEKADKIDLILSALENLFINNTINLETGSYMLDDGQTRINRTFRSLDEIEKSYQSWIRIQNMYRRRANQQGRVILTHRDVIKRNGLYGV